MPADAPLRVRADAADAAAETFAARGEESEALIGRCMASHYREALGEEER